MIRVICFNKTTINYFFYIYTIAIILLCTLPINSPGSESNDFFSINIRFDYLAHFILFIAWMFLWRKFTKSNFKEEMSRSPFLMIPALLFAFGSELIQYFLPYRTFNVNDLIANSLGVGGGVVFLFLHRKTFINYFTTH